VLEIGVGTGRIALPLSVHVNTYFGLDLSRPMMMRLKAKHATEPIYLAQGDATQLPCPDHIFDAVVAVHVFHLIPNWRGVIDELTRVLRPGAPVIHCWSKTDEVFKTLSDVWRETISSASSEVIGVRWENNNDFLAELGWKTDAEIYEYTYPQRRTPAEYVENLRKRIWSQTWRLSDDELARSVAAVEAAIRDHYPDPMTPVEGTAHVYARAFYPPQN
jgi:SAM-dependent methyltransferase